MIGKDISGFLAHIPVLTVGNGVSGKSFHKIHLSQSTYGILNEIQTGFEFIDKFYNVSISPITESGIFGLCS